MINFYSVKSHCVLLSIFLSCQDLTLIFILIAVFFKKKYTEINSIVRGLNELILGSSDITCLMVCFIHGVFNSGRILLCPILGF